MILWAASFRTRPEKETSTMTIVYLIRHCEATGNIDGTFQGWTDNSITERGKQQLKALEQRFAAISLDAVYTSDLQRAYLTGCAVKGAHEIPILTCQNLREIHGGKWEGLTWEQIGQRYAEELYTWRHVPEQHQCPGGESFAQVRERMSDAVLNIVKNHPGQSVAIASHGAALRCYLSALQGYPLDRLYESGVLMDNTAVSKVQFHSDGSHHICYLADNSHLAAGDLSTLAHTHKPWLPTQSH